MWLSAVIGGMALWMLVNGRLPHGAYFSVANLSAAAMAPKGGRGKAMAAIGMGLAVATRK